MAESLNILDGPLSGSSGSVDLRPIADPPATRDRIYGQVEDAVRTMPKAQSRQYTLQVRDPQWKDPPEPDKEERKQAVLRGETLGRRLEGTWELTDNNTGEVVGRQRRLLARVPKMTDEGTFVHRGTEYGIKHAQRLRPGVYTRRKASGESEAHVNVLEGGPGSRIEMNPKSGALHLSVGQTRTPLISVLGAMGKTGRDLREAWGGEVHAANQRYDDGAKLRQLKQKLLKNREASDEELRGALERMRLDPEVNLQTLGRAHDRVTGDTLLDASRRVLGVSRGEQRPDDRDHLAYQTVSGPEDIMAERIRGDRAGEQRRMLFKIAGRGGDVSKIPSAALQRQLDSALMDSGLGIAVESINPAELMDKQTQMTRMGEGGIASADQIPEEARSVHPSQAGFVDLIRSPESERVGVETNLARSVMKGSDGRIYAPFIDAKTGREELRSPQDIANSTVAFPEALSSSDDQVPAIRGNKLRHVPRGEVDYVLPSFENAFSPMSNLVPMKQNMKGQRLAMGARFLGQAVPVANAEAPLVRGAVPGKGGQESFEHRYGPAMGAVRADKDGTVVEASRDHVTVRGDDGERKTFPLDRDRPYSRKTFMTQEPVVEPGQRVRAGDTVAKSNFTDREGTAALGRNLRTAYLPWKGLPFEDALVLSESAANKMSSDHAYQHQLDATDERTRLGKASYLSVFPGTYDRQTLDKLDDDGVVKPGTQVEKGDPLILGMQQRERAAHKVHRKGQRPFNDQTVTWDHEDTGVVSDVAKTNEGPRVIVKARRPAQVGDKFCYDEETEVLTSQGWVPVGELSLSDEVCTLHGDRIEYERPKALHTYPRGGSMYYIDTQQVNLFVTADHQMYARKRNHENFGLYPARELFGKRVSYAKSGIWHGCSPSAVVLPEMRVKAGQGGRGHRMLPEVRMPVKTYLMLLGCYLSDGNTFSQKSYGIDITKRKVAHKRELLEELDSLGINYVDSSSSDKIRIYSKQLMEEFRQYGHSAGEKFIPDHVLMWHPEDLEVLFRWLIWGDGGYTTSGACAYFTVSPYLADGVQRLCLHTGRSANVQKLHDGGTYWILGKTGTCLPYYRVGIVSKKLCPTVNHAHVRKQSAQHEYMVDYDGPVHCVSVSSGVLYVRRNGKPCWSGNSNRFANKGVTAVLPDAQMPRDKDGNPFEMVTNPLGVISRANVSQAYETALGKVAEKTGKPQIVDDFDPRVQSRAEWVQDKLRQHGLSSTEDVIDPETDTKIPRVLAGPQHVMKLHHQAEDKESARGGSGAYTAEGQPAKGPGGGGGAKRLALMDTNALLAHGAVHNLRDATAVRGQSNDDYWRQLMQGYRPRQPKEPMVYQKLIDSLRGSGINVVPDGAQTHVMALTDKDIDELAADRRVTNSGTVRWEKDLEPVKGGLFDRSATGGHHGQKFSAIDLAEPMPNPVMEEPIRRTLGLTQKQFEDTIAGEREIPGHGTGPRAVQKALDDIDVDRQIERDKHLVEHGSKSARDQAVRRLRYMQRAKERGLHPRDWMLNKAPVLPPQFRPVTRMGSDKIPITDDANLLYRDLVDANENLSSAKQELGEEGAGDERRALYRAFKGVTGLGEPVSQVSQEKGARGLLKGVFGPGGPKTSFMQRKLLSNTVNNVGRAVVTPDPDLDMDQIAIPEDMAFNIYEPFIIRRLARRGMPVRQAINHAKQRTSDARASMQEEMRSRPVIMNRAPVLHRFGIMAFEPQVTKDSTTHVPPLIVKGLGMDFDGDQANFHVPTDEHAREEALNRMKPSQQLLSPADFKSPMHAPSQEYQGGLYQATAQRRQRPVRTFRSVEDMRRAWRQGEIDARDPVRILEQSQ